MARRSDSPGLAARAPGPGGGFAIRRDRLRTILALGLPMVGGMTSQTVFNLVDTAMVGRLGPQALAAVGIAGFAGFMCAAVVMGMSAGVQAMAARRKGEGRDEEAAVPLNGGLALVLAVSIPLSLALMTAAPALIEFLNADPEVAALGGPYLQARLAGMAAIGMNFAFRGYWNGIGRPMVYLRTLLAMQVLNVAFNYVLIFGALGFPALGTLGSGIGTTLATWAGTAMYLRSGWRGARGAGFLTRLPRRETMLTMARLSAPASVQQFFFAAGFTAMMWIVGRVGTAELAAANVLVNVLLVAILPGLAMGLAAASLVGRSLGRGERDAARLWAWDVVKVTAAAMGVLGLPMIAAPGPILGAFLHDPEALALAEAPLRISGAAILADAVGMVLMNALNGAGATRSAMIVSIGVQWLLFLPAAFLAGPVLGFGLLGVWLCHAGWRAVQAAVFAALWRRGRWAYVRV